jgi:hypothetical protein
MSVKRRNERLFPRFLLPDDPACGAAYDDVADEDEPGEQRDDDADGSVSLAVAMTTDEK